MLLEVQSTIIRRSQIASWTATHAHNCVPNLRSVHVCNGLAIFLEWYAELEGAKPDVHGVNVKCKLPAGHGVRPIKGQVGYRTEEHAVLKVHLGGVKLL